MSRPETGPHRLGPSAPGSVVVDIGGTRGALLVHVPGSAGGEEIEIRLLGAPWRGDHVAVRERRAGERVTKAALFGSLDAGIYEIRWREHRRVRAAQTVEVLGGAVSESVIDGT